MLCQLRLNGQDLRLAQRRAAERTDDFKTDYRMRGGIEATNSMLKRVAGLNRLRVRGRLAVFSQHSAESRRLEFTASGQCAITDRQTDERWEDWGFCGHASRNFRALARSHIASKRLPALHSRLTDSNPELRQIPTLKQPTFVARVYLHTVCCSAGFPQTWFQEIVELMSSTLSPPLCVLPAG